MCRCLVVMSLLLFVNSCTEIQSEKSQQYQLVTDTLVQEPREILFRLLKEKYTICNGYKIYYCFKNSPGFIEEFENDSFIIFRYSTNELFSFDFSFCKVNNKLYMNNEVEWPRNGLGQIFSDNGRSLDGFLQLMNDFEVDSVYSFAPYYKFYFDNLYQMETEILHYTVLNKEIPSSYKNRSITPFKNVSIGVRFSDSLRNDILILTFIRPNDPRIYKDRFKYQHIRYYFYRNGEILVPVNWQ